MSIERIFSDLSEILKAVREGMKKHGELTPVQLEDRSFDLVSVAKDFPKIALAHDLDMRVLDVIVACESVAGVMLYGVVDNSREKIMVVANLEKAAIDVIKGGWMSPERYVELFCEGDDVDNKSEVRSLSDVLRMIENDERYQIITYSDLDKVILSVDSDGEGVSLKDVTGAVLNAVPEGNVNESLFLNVHFKGSANGEDGVSRVASYQSQPAWMMKEIVESAHSGENLNKPAFLINTFNNATYVAVEYTDQRNQRSNESCVRVVELPIESLLQCDTCVKREQCYGAIH